jgi:UDP-glucuronate decarboxylase
MRVLITGATGFLGSRAAMHLSSLGHEVHGVVRPGGSRERLAALAPKTSVHEADLANAARIRSLAHDTRPDLAIHLAWYAVPGKYLTSDENLRQVEATLALAGALSEARCPRLVTAGTCFEYDTAYGLLSEHTPTAPRFLYSACKLAVFEMLRQACRGWAMSFCHLRFFYTYGPWEAPARLVPAVIGPLLKGQEARVTSGEQVRDFLHIDDVASAIGAASTSAVEGAVNVGSGAPVWVRDVVAAAARACGREDLVRYGALPGREGDPPFICAAVDRLRALGWRPRFDLDSGLRDTVAWYREKCQ